MQIYGGIFAIQLYWNHTSVISRKFAVFLQSTFPDCQNYIFINAHISFCFCLSKTIFPPPISRIPTLISHISTATPGGLTPIPPIPTLNISHKLLRPSQSLKKFVETTYLQTTWIMGGARLVSKFMWGIFEKKLMKNKRWFGKTWYFFSLWFYD